MLGYRRNKRRQKPGDPSPLAAVSADREASLLEQLVAPGLSRQERRALLPEEDLAARRFWRDEKLMRLMRHKQCNGDNNG